MKCHACSTGRKWECEQHGQCTTGSINQLGSNATDNLLSEQMVDEEVPTEAYVPGKPEREVNTYKDESTIRDQQSTGRKRAALMYPLHPELACEWRGKDNVGGHKSIMGCINGLQQARHHGPDKNTLNNDEGNVHRICHVCHNRWHTENDPDYVWGQIYEPHSPTDATPTELLQNQMNWASRTLVKAKD